MTTRKNQNSILVLATLGVYLGLVLVGATPQILAQAAMTKQFNVKDEIEVKDDLDTKPDDCEQLREEVRGYEIKYLWFNHTDIATYANLVEELSEAYPEKQLERLDLVWTTSGKDRPFAHLTSTSNSRPQLVPVDVETRNFLEREILFLANGFPGNGIEISFTRDQFETIWKLKVTNNGIDTARLARAYASSLDVFRCRQSLAIDEIIFKNTQVAVEDNNLVVTTRLPRGSLDPLLAASAK